MPLPPELAEVLQRLHREFVRGRDARSRVLGAVGEALGVLPITDNWEHDFGIRVADGEVIVFSRVPPHDPAVEPPGRRRLGILNAARFKHPELSGLIPPRPLDAVECEFCDGRGERTGGDGVVRSCPHCAAGWMPRSLVSRVHD